ncbi:MAG: glycosyltransferase family 2 protein [Deltaproteobacteria bacterium]|nr:glycosyltransferase family 2 protein [Deltaproteobacteria bacterium]
MSAVQEAGVGFAGADVAVIVVAYRAGTDLFDCVQALRADTDRSAEIIVVDNGGLADEVAEVAARFSPVTVLGSGHNLGFAGGVNLAMRWLLGRNGRKPRVVALVNQDCVVRPGWLAPLVAALLEPGERVAVAGATLLDARGLLIQHAGGVIHVNGLTDHMGRGRGADEAGQLQARDVDYVTGALCALSVDAWSQLGPMDEGYHPVYFEEVDYCVRARAQGYRVVYVPASEGLHEEAASSGVGSRLYLDRYHRGRVRFAFLHLLGRGRRLRFIAAELKWLASLRSREQLLSALGAWLAYLRGDVSAGRQKAAAGTPSHIFTAAARPSFKGPGSHGR